MTGFVNAKAQLGLKLGRSQGIWKLTEPPGLVKTPCPARKQFATPN
jgi:hypothetical protein